MSEETKALTSPDPSAAEHDPAGAGAHALPADEALGESAGHPEDGIPKHYRSGETEARWDAYWEEHGFFHSQPDGREPYTIVIPPPNVTGVLHMGHMLNNTIQDVLVRRARMLGRNACWVPGTDHASIATEAKVVQRLRSKGITKRDLTRDEFLKHAWEWTEEHGGIILKQLRTLGASCDWARTRFTLEPSLSDAVTDCFITLYERGYIYRGLRMVNWDPVALTAVSDEEVIHKETSSSLYHIRYMVDDSTGDHVVIATTRPETLLADTAIAVHPEDPRYAHLIGRMAVVPFAGRRIPIIADEYVDREFGTGCLKVTPAHDPNDHEIGLKHGLEVIDMFHPDAKVSLDIKPFHGMDRFEARKEMVKRLEAEGLLAKVEEIRNQVGYSERTDSVIEPRLSLQWFCRMQELSKPALEHVLNGDIRFHPSKFVKPYQHWMENIRDWCISRQLWWGHRIPAWYHGDDERFVIAATREEAALKATREWGMTIRPDDLRQDEDVLDTWFSSWLWPISVFDGFKDPDNPDIRYYYPTQDLVTAPEIMFFWVARMIIAGYEFRGEKPFGDVYYTGIVRDKQRRKMSKSLGNSPDPLDLINTYGADGTRVGMLFASPAGNDLLFDEALCEQGRNFANKIWNAFRFLMMNQPTEHGGGRVLPSFDPSPSHLADAWFASRLSAGIAEMDRHFAEYRLNDALKTIYSLIWDDFCDWYIELIKSGVPGQPIEPARLSQALGAFEILMKLLHPFMPFLSEEIWQRLGARTPGESVTVAPWPQPFASPMSASELARFGHLQGVLAAIRNTQAELNISPRKEIPVILRAATHDEADALRKASWIVTNIMPSAILTVGADVEPPKGSRSTLVGPYECFIPMSGLIDTEAELARIDADIQRLVRFRQSVEAKLGNANFVDRAPADVVELERRKLKDTLDALQKLEMMRQDLT